MPRSIPRLNRLAAMIIAIAAISVLASAGVAKGLQEGRPPLLGPWKLIGVGNGFVVKAKGDHLYVVNLKTRFTGRCQAHPNAVAKVPAALRIKRVIRPNSPPSYFVADYANALIGGKTYRVHLTIIFSSMYPNQIFGGTFGAEGCTAVISGGHHR